MDANYDNEFIWKISVCSSVAYLLATLPQYFIDPLLKHEVTFGERHYPGALWLVIPLAIFVLFFTLHVMRNSGRILVAISPFALAALVSIPIFGPEIPHGNLVAISFIWSSILLLTLWIHNRAIEKAVIDTLKSSKTSVITTKLEYVKEEVQFWRTLFIVLGGGYIALIISWANFLIALSKAQVGDNASEAFILDDSAMFAIGVITILVIVCPIGEAARRHQEATKLFLTLKDKEPPSERRRNDPLRRR